MSIEKVLQIMNVIDPLIVAISFVVVIVFLVVSYLTLFLKKTKELKQSVKSAIETLPSEDHRNDFTKRYHEIDDKLSETCVFDHLWKEFTEQLVEPHGDEGAFQNSMRAQDFFTLEAVLKKKEINFKLIESIPGILVGLGVFGTFLGLTFSLLQVLPQLNGEDPPVKDAINTLLSGAGVAFVTSVFGLFSSLIFNKVSDLRIFRIQHDLDKFNSRLDKSLKFVTEEHLLMKYLEELHQQNKYLESMDEKIALKIGDYIEQMGEKLHGAISQGNQNISEKFLLDMADKMTQGMGDFSKNQMENVNKTLTVLQENIPSLISDLKNAQQDNEKKIKEVMSDLAVNGRDNQIQINESLNKTVENMRIEFGGIIESLKQGMDQTLSHSSGELKEIIASLGQTNQKILEQTNESQAVYKEHLGETADKLHSFVNRLEKTVGEINDVTNENIKGVINDFYRAIEQQRNITEENRLYIESLNNLTESLKPIPSSLLEVNQKFPEIIERVNRSNEDLKNIWSQYESRFQDVDQSAREIFVKIKEGLESIAKQSGDYVQDLNKQTAQISHNFSQAVEELKESIEELPNYKKRVS